MTLSIQDSRCVDKKQINQAAKVILQVAEKCSKNDLTNPLEQQVVNLQLGFKKIPNIRTKIIKINLPTPLTQKTTDVCLFVKDLDANERDFEPTVRHFKELLNTKGVNRHIEVIPLKALKIEYQPYEAKRNLSNMFDVYLADDRIVRLLPKYLGKNFLGRKKFPMQVNLRANDLKKEVERVLSTTQCVLTSKGSSCQVTVARTGMTADQIALNTETAIIKLTNTIPGGATNVRSLHIKTISSPSLPIFVSLGSRDDITLPVVERKSQEIGAEEITTVPGSLVKITSRGRVELVDNPEEDSDNGGPLQPLEEGSEGDESEDEAKPVKKVPRKRSRPDSEEDEGESAEDNDSNSELPEVHSKGKRKRDKGNNPESPLKDVPDKDSTPGGKKRKVVPIKQKKVLSVVKKSPANTKKIPKQVQKFTEGKSPKTTKNPGPQKGRKKSTKGKKKSV